VGVAALRLFLAMDGATLSRIARDAAVTTASTLADRSYF
jgi:hypothetical protein